MPPISVRA